MLRDPETVLENLSHLSVDDPLLHPLVLGRGLQGDRVHAALTAEVTDAQPVLLYTLQGRITPGEEVSIGVWKGLVISEIISRCISYSYPLPSGARSWMILLAHNSGFGGCRILPLGNWATHTPTNRKTVATNNFIAQRDSAEVFDTDLVYEHRRSDGALNPR